MNYRSSRREGICWIFAFLCFIAVTLSPLSNMPHPVSKWGLVAVLVMFIIVQIRITNWRKP